MGWYAIKTDWPTRMLVPARVPSIDQKELFKHLKVCKEMTDAKLNC